MITKEPIKIAFFDARPYDIESFEKISQDTNFKITFFKNHLTPETASLTQGFQAVCVFVNDVINKEVIDVLERNGITLVAIRATGYNNVDIKTIFKRIHVVRVPTYSPHAVAEHAVALMLALNRNIHRAYYRARDNNFALNGLLGFDMYGKTAGIIGTGEIGKITINILKGFGMEILAYDIYPDKAYAKQTKFNYTDLETIYRKSDIISLHCPLTAETHRLIDGPAIAKMKHGVMIINTSRGLVIDTRALIEGLKNGQVGFAGLDVYEEESKYFFEDFSNKLITDDSLARLLSFNNVIVTSHQGFFTKEALHNIALTTIENIRAYFTEQKLPNEICYQCSAGASCPRQVTGKCF